MNIQNLSHKRKGQGFSIGLLPVVAVTLGVLVIVLAMGSLLMQGFADSTSNQNVTDVVAKGQAGLQTFADQIDLLVIGVVLVVILGIIVGALYWLQRRSGAGV